MFPVQVEGYVLMAGLDCLTQLKQRLGPAEPSTSPNSPHPRPSIRRSHVNGSREASSWTPAVTPSLSVSRLALDRLFTVRAAWTSRNPRLLFRLSMVFLFRLDACRLLDVLFHDPPRITRRSPNGQLPRSTQPGRR